MTNQASEDELKQRFATLFYDDNYEFMLSEPDLFDVCAINAAVELIRTEKLKLLAEVRERVIGEKIAPNFDNEYGYCDNCEFQPTDGTRHCLCYYDEKLRKKQRAVLTKLEAEL